MLFDMMFDDNHHGYLFSEIDPVSGVRQTRPQYQAYRCERCGKVDEVTAIRSGLPSGLAALRGDIVSTADHVLIVSSRVREVIESHTQQEVEYYLLPDNSSHFVVLPRKVVRIHDTADYLRVIGRCPKCNRYAEATWSEQIPPRPDVSSIGAFELESTIGLILSWVVSGEMRNALQKLKPKLRNLTFRVAYS